MVLYGTFRVPKEVSIWQNAVFVIKALFLDKMFLIHTERPIDVGSPISAK